jgi:dipeptidyl aminopeptidase/acylaminoacyl peptidase
MRNAASRSYGEHHEKIVGFKYRFALRGSLLCLSLMFSSRGLAEKPGFTVRDSIEMQTFSIPSQLAQSDEPDWAPDRRHFVVVTSRGLLLSNKVESTIWLFDTNAVGHFLEGSGISAMLSPRVIARVSATPKLHSYMPYAAVVSNIRWSSDSSVIYFLGQNSDGERQLYQVAVRGEPVKILTPKGLDVRRYDVTAQSIAYMAVRSAAGTPLTTPEKLHRPRPVTGTQLTDILFPEQAAEARNTELWLMRKKSRQVRNPANEAFPPDRDYYGDVLSLSPDGHWGVRLRSLQTVPESWTRYEPLPGYDSWRIKTGDLRLISPDNIYRLRQYVLVDMASGKVSPLLDAPLGSTLAYTDDTNHAVWAPDGRRLILTNTYLSLAGADPEKEREYIHPCAAASLDVATGNAHCIVQSRIGSSRLPTSAESLRLQKASFGVDDNHVVLAFNDSRQAQLTEQYEYVDGRWIVVSGGTPNVDGNSTLPASATPEVTLRQSLNEPPVLWGVDRISGRSKELWNPNPQLSNLNFGHASVYQWRDPTGYLWTAGLIKPVGYIEGHRYPLVIQTHGFSADRFITDGAYTTAMAARPLASAGFVVLQVADRTDHYGSRQEALDQLEGYRSAIRQLVSEGLIDQAHVGIIGFSRTSWYVETALILEPHLFAAATIADGVDFSYMQYMLFGEGRLQFQQEYERINGGQPFGPNLGRWLEQAPGFHLDQVQTPLRIEAIGASSLLQEWELYSALRQQHKPVDLFYLPDGQHILQTPVDRMASQQGDVDWLVSQFAR